MYKFLFRLGAAIALVVLFIESSLLGHIKSCSATPRPSCSATPRTSPVKGACPDPDKMVLYQPSGMCYWVGTETFVEHSQAFDVCHKQRGNLIVLLSEDQFYFIVNTLISGLVIKPDRFWLGMDNKQHGDWITWDDMPVPWIRWDEQQPNDRGSVCAYMHLQLGMSDRSCTYAQRDVIAICETDILTTTTTKTTTRTSTTSDITTKTTTTTRAPETTTKRVGITTMTTTTIENTREPTTATRTTTTTTETTTENTMTTTLVITGTESKSMPVVAITEAMTSAAKSIMVLNTTPVVATTNTMTSVAEQVTRTTSPKAQTPVMKSTLITAADHPKTTLTSRLDRGQIIKQQMYRSCRCVKKNTTLLALHHQIQKIQNGLFVRKNETSRYLRRKQSVYDGRSSMTVIGVCGLAICCVIYSVIFAHDIVYAYRKVSKNNRDAKAINPTSAAIAH